MDSRYLRLNAEEVFEIKRQINYTEERIISILRNIRNYKTLRKKEEALKNKLKVAISQFKARISLMESTFPDDERKNAEYRVLKKTQQIKKHNQVEYHHSNFHNPITNPESISSNPDKDLEEIKRKLERLGM